MTNSGETLVGDSPDPSVGSPIASVKGVELLVDDPVDVRRQKLARIILDSMYQFLGLLDIDGTVIEINKAALAGAGIELQEVVGKPFWEARWWALSEETRQRVKSMVAQAREGRFVRCDIEIYGKSRGTGTIVVDFSLTPIFDDRGEIAFLLPEGRDVSEKIEIEAELTRKNNEVNAALEKLREIDGFKTKFFANVSHDLRTPLTLILGPVNQLLHASDLVCERDQFRLKAIKRNAQALLQQVNDLLDLGRIDAGEMPLVYSCLDVTALLREVAAGFAAAAAERGISLTVPNGEELEVDVDRRKFGRVITNLLANALKFTPDGGRIRCSVSRLSRDRFLVSVQDNGPGVPDKLKSAIFDRYSQGEDQLSAKGSGLGLNIVKELVELHRGTISVLDAPERGAVFQVELPLRAPSGAFVRATDSTGDVSPDVEAGPLRSLEAPHVSGRRGEARILVVEDNPDLRQFLYDVLADDYQVALAENGEAALRVAQEWVPDMVVTDLMMPEMDGERFVRIFREQHTENIPVLVLSARADDALRESLLEDLVQDYVTKPFSPQELRARVRNLVTVKLTADILRKELNSQASDIKELTAGLIASHKSLQDGLMALQISERRWQGFYENTAVGIALLDTDGKIMKANPALQKMLGYQAHDIGGVSLIDLTEESERAKTRRNVMGLLEGRVESYQVKKRYERSDGGFLWANVIASVIPLVDVHAPRIAVIVEDVTAQKAAEDALAKTQTELVRVSRVTTMGELVASIAHEVNQPLSAIVTNSHAALRWIERETPDYEEVVAALHRVHRDAVHAGKVISRIRNFLKDRGLKRGPVNVRDMIDSLVQMLQRALTETATSVDVRIKDPLPALEADQVQLQQVMLNLLVNALDAMRRQKGKGRKIVVAVEADASGGVLFSVSDSGPGIPADKISGIFEPFYSTKEDGLGMGLAISRSIVEGHGGKLWLESCGPQGACFCFTIPATQD
ncbi:PAS domain S-box protein [Aromatoleum toluvorans]|uniref:histidine kinase n=1 Tax=Aromatoleum toluvorans TaxID=92002 RepID=A0ABX1PWE4_9RHOO|nr:ATP-binding protein [Aromatoleum toluvorans]NMG43012.1 PAS domain S-box protein [Aromatoleum toluvorans]